MIQSKSDCRAFTLIEIIVVLLIVGLFSIFAGRILATVVKGYVVAQNADEIVQKAQIALQRMSIEFSYIQVGATTGDTNSLNYVGGSIIGNHTISLVGSNVLYSQDGTDYVLTDGVVANGLQFSYYNSYDSEAASSFSTNTQLIGISLTMNANNSAITLSKAFKTRVLIKNF